MGRFFLALQFLTVFRLKRDVVYGPGDPARAIAWFPAVGALLGAAAGLLDFLLLKFLPPGAAAVLTVAALAVFTGALHLDGFADTVDALAGGATREDRLRIMKDPAVGAVGVAFLVFLIAFKCLAIGALDGPARWRAVFVMPVVGRWAIAPLAWRSSPARPDGLGASFYPVRGLTVLAATVLAAVAAAAAFGPAALVIIAAVGALSVLAARFFEGKTGGATGDVYGFWCESSELITLLLFHALLPAFNADEAGW